jgi:GH25 family lysozyme M1 (1,4-beta-N-acetylmuramidase)
MTIITDCSFYQNDPTTPQSVDFDMMARNADGVILRAGQNLWIDKDFKKYWDASKGKLPRGSYWFYDSRVSPKQQAQLWATALDGNFGEMPHFADFEDKYGGKFGRWQDWYNFLEESKLLIPSIGIYTGYYYWTERTISAGISLQQLAYFGKYPLWIAAYNTTAPRIPAPWKEWTFWQYTDNGDGTQYGVESKNIDLNHYSGTAEEFQASYGLTSTSATLIARFGDTLVEYRRK